MTEIRQDTAINSTLNVNLLDYSDHLYGLDSKKYKIYAASSSANPMVKVQPWIGLSSDLNNVKSAIIENLIIDGQNLSGIVGICLQNVYNCWIRNLTIKNCEVGIKLQLTYGAWSEFNRIEHIRMENVKTGILFVTDGYNNPEYPGNSTGFTHIDDVGIKLKNDSSAVGIQIGAPDGSGVVIDPYSAYIKANVWIQSAGGVGLQIKKGRLQYGLINLAVEGPSNGIGINVQDVDNAVIANNQTFKRNDGQSSAGVFLTCAGISESNRIKPETGWDKSNIDVKYY